MLGDVDCGSFKLSTVEIADFAAGFVSGFSGNNDKADFESCYHESATFDTDICTLVTDFESKDTKEIIAGVKLIMKDATKLVGDLSGCPANVQTDIKTVGDWATYWEGKPEIRVIAAARKNVKAHMDEIKTDAAQITTDYASKDYYDAAKMAASIAKLALPVESEAYGDQQCTKPDGEVYTLDTIQIADYLAGFMEGFSGVNHKEEMEACFQDTDDFEKNICDIVYGLSTKDNQQVLKAMQQMLHVSIPQLKTFMTSCPTVQTDWVPVHDWFAYWVAQGTMKVYQNLYHNMTTNMPVVKADYHQVYEDYHTNDFYKSGLDFSILMKLLLPVQAEETAIETFLQ